MSPSAPRCRFCRTSTGVLLSERSPGATIRRGAAADITAHHHAECLAGFEAQEAQRSEAARRELEAAFAAIRAGGAR